MIQRIQRPTGRGGVEVAGGGRPWMRGRARSSALLRCAGEATRKEAVDAWMDKEGEWEEEGKERNEWEEKERKE